MNKSSLSTNKVNFKFSGDAVEDIKLSYDNLLQDTSFTFSKFKFHASRIEERYLGPTKRTHDLDQYQHENIRDKQDSLTTYFMKTIEQLDSSCMLLLSEYPKQQSTNSVKAKKMKKALEKNK